MLPPLRFKDMPDYSGAKTLEEIATKTISYGIVQAGPHVQGGMPYIKSQNLSKPLRLDDLQCTSEEIAQQYRRSEVVPGDIVFSLRGNLGVAQVVPREIPTANLTQGTARISVAPTSSRYLLFALQTKNLKRQIEARAKGSTFREISLQDLRKVQVELPSGIEQQKIADFLTSVDARIQQLKQKQSLLQQYKKGLMQQLFSQTLRFKDDNGNSFPDWDHVKLGKAVEVNPRTSSLPEEFLYIDLESVKGGRLGDPKLVQKADAPSRAQRGLKKSDILFQTVRPYQKNNFFFSREGSYVASTGYAQLRTTRNSPQFIYQYLHLDSFVSLVLNRCTGTSYPAINSSDLADVKIKLPCVEEQTKIANALAAMDKKIDLVAQQIEHTQTFKKGLLQQMFV